MAWCETNGVDYLFGLARNKRLNAAIEAQLKQAREASSASSKPARRFKDFTYRTLSSWSCERRVVGKAEWMGPSPAESQADPAAPGRANPCFVVTSLAANQLRLWLASFAYMLVSAVRRIALTGTRLAQATCASIRLALFKIGALVRTSVRRIKLSMASACPSSDLFRIAWAALDKAAH